MHILYISGGDIKYGAPTSLYNLIKQLKRLDSSLNISVIMPSKNSLGDKLKDLGCSVYVTKYGSFRYGISKNWIKFLVKYMIKLIPYLWGRVFALKSLESQLNFNTVDIIHCNTATEDLGAMIAKKYNKPFYWHIREYGDLDYNCYSYRKNYIDYMGKSNARFIMVSKSVKEHWVKKGLTESRCYAIYNGVSDEVEFKKNYTTDGGCLKLVMVGSVQETKGQHILVEAINILPQEIKENVSVDIIGDGPIDYVNALQQTIEKFNLSKQVRLLGYINNSDINLIDYDCGVICSKSEAFGRVTAEYMISGLPVLASIGGANSELIIDGLDGYLFERDNAKKLSDIIEKIFNNRSVIEYMGKNARRKAVDEFTSNRNAKNILSLYKETAFED